MTEFDPTSADRSKEPSPITDYHAKYYAHALTRRSSSDNLEKLGQTLLNATVDLNPHQIDAAMFAFRSPLSRGALLADEVGLGKTIEAALTMSQLWAERKRKSGSSRRQAKSELSTVPTPRTTPISSSRPTRPSTSASPSAPVK